jgi:hypothetical protein
MASSSTSALSDDVMWEKLPDELLLRVLEHVMLRRGVKEWRAAVRGVRRQWRAVHDGACTSLRYLFLRHGVRHGVPDEVMRALCGRLPALTDLDLSMNDGLTADGLCAVGGLTALTHLDLFQCNVTDEVMHALGGLPALTFLNLREISTTTTADGLCAVGGLTALTYLDLGFCTFTDAVLQELRGHTALTSLSIEDPPEPQHVTDMGLRELRGLTKLSKLDLAGCTHVTDAGLQHLTSLTQLTRLQLFHNTSTTEAGRDALKAALPALRFYASEDDW